MSFEYVSGFFAQIIETTDSFPGIGLEGDHSESAGDRDSTIPEALSCQRSTANDTVPFASVLVKDSRPAEAGQKRIATAAIVTIASRLINENRNRDIFPRSRITSEISERRKEFADE